MAIHQNAEVISGLQPLDVSQSNFVDGAGRGGCRYSLPPACCEFGICGVARMNGGIAHVCKPRGKFDFNHSLGGGGARGSGSGREYGTWRGYWRLSGVGWERGRRRRLSWDAVPIGSESELGRERVPVVGACSFLGLDHQSGFDEPSVPHTWDVDNSGSRIADVGCNDKGKIESVIHRELYGEEGGDGLRPRHVPRHRGRSVLGPDRRYCGVRYHQRTNGVDVYLHTVSIPGAIPYVRRRVEVVTHCHGKVHCPRRSG
mmetsp:Transcript_25264/g.35080  ORF Transcript_25264/g.35080 Transcript_25264/m.35080 type:complete len:258 (-) Transcript_25264:23-796(-)